MPIPLPFVDVAQDETKPSQPPFGQQQRQGPVPVVTRAGYPDPGFNPQEITPVGDGHDDYPANPVVAWFNFGTRPVEQSAKPQNTGATNQTPRAPLDQQRGSQQPPVQYPNQITQSPVPWDDEINLTGGTRRGQARLEDQQDAFVRLAQGFRPKVVY